MGFFRALGLFGQAVRLLRRDADLRRWTGIAAAVCAACFGLLIVGLRYAIPMAFGSLWAKPEGALAILWYAAVVFLYIAAFVVSAQTLPILLLAPVTERLSIATEKSLGVQEKPGNIVRFVAETGRAVLKALYRVSLLLIGHTLLLLLWVIPGYGHAAWAALSTLWSMYWLAFEYVDVTANRHGLRFRQVLSLLRAHAGGALGLGVGIYFLLWIPIVNVFFVPVAVVTATLFFRSTNV